MQVGMGGRNLIELGRPPAFSTDSILPAHTFRHEDLARVQAHSGSSKTIKNKKTPKSATTSASEASLEGVVYKVLLATCHSADGRVLDNVNFELIIIDEATQALEASCWIPVVKGKKTHFSRRSNAIATHYPQPRWTNAKKSSSDDLPIDSQLTSDSESGEDPQDETESSRPQAKNKVIALDESEKSREILGAPIVFFDASGCEYFEKSNEREDEGSKCNENEAMLVKSWVDKLVGAGILPSQIAVISPYQAQVTLVSSILSASYGVGTVDGMQGREKEAIIISLVRSNDKREVGFLKDKRRLNGDMTFLNYPL
ncbi:hypothetical protein EW145_g7665 [Phellinidium pouzarii]|uniref:DNA2/NAM7 helicase-like C-terminal domain-containing protein n=1 Tax=Phellinidium pouzarii TaxID=167371 RepID=A0A4V3XA89_9AGAM|nr:hypothetical protein EW145_g7665 [Phellinidium pouzarii]